MTSRSTALRLAAVAALLILVVFSTTARAADDDKNLEILSHKVVKPLLLMDLQQRFSPLHMNVSTPGMQSLGNNKTRLIYWSTLQLPDGTFMDLSRSYDVTRTRDNASEGRFANLSVYQVRAAGEKNSLLTVGLSPSDDVVVLEGTAASGIPGLIPRP